MRETIKKALAGETATFEDIYTSTTGGKTAFFRGKVSPVVPGQSPTDVIATLEDITELKKHESEQHKLEKLESLGVLAVETGDSYVRSLTQPGLKNRKLQLLYFPSLFGLNHFFRGQISKKEHNRLVAADETAGCFPDRSQAPAGNS